MRQTGAVTLAAASIGGQSGAKAGAMPKSEIFWPN